MRRRSDALPLRGLVAAVCLSLGTVAAPLAAEPGPKTPPADRRAADQTFLTYPEWFLVFSPEEYADWVEDRPPSRFPFLGHTVQLWAGYAAATRATPPDLPVNWGYHGMILVIATSTTVEYTIRAAWESSVGALSESLETDGPSNAERYGAKVARDYEQFLRQEPWYRFDYVAALRGLWQTPVGPSPLRDAERRYTLTTEYVAKAGYAWLIGYGTAASYDPALPTTVVVLEPGVDPVPLGALEARPLPDGAQLATLPRYEAFMTVAERLAGAGARFEEIAGNRGAILVSARVPSGTSLPGEVVFRQAMLTRPGTERVLLSTPVPALCDALRALNRPGIAVEHVYDY